MNKPVTQSQLSFPNEKEIRITYENSSSVKWFHYVANLVIIIFSGKQKADTWFENLVNLVAKKTEAVRKKRNFEKKRKYKLKYPITKRRVL